jgi:hypothetical protein
MLLQRQIIKPLGNQNRYIEYPVYTKYGIKSFHSLAGRLYLSMLSNIGLYYYIHKTNKAGRRFHSVNAVKPTYLCILFCISRECLLCCCCCLVLLRYYYHLMFVQMFLQRSHLFLKIPLRYLLLAAMMF